MHDEQLLQKMVSRLGQALDGELVGAVLYGPRAREDTMAALGPLNLMIVTADLEPDTLASLGSPVRWWLGKGQSWPRLFTLTLIRDSVDVFPVEFLDLSQHRRILYGEDPLLGIDVNESHLRLQCERDIREKLMRLREGYVECSGSARELQKLMATSYTSFAPLWRACLHLLGCDVPDGDAEVAIRLFQRLGIDSAPLEEVALVAGGARLKDLAGLFARYLRQLSETAACIDQHLIEQKGT